MKKTILAISVLTIGSVSAVDRFSYCTDFLNRSNNVLGINEDFSFVVKNNYEILKNPVDTIDIQFNPTEEHQALQDYRIIDRDVKLDRRDGIETEVIRVGHTDTRIKNNGEARNRDAIDYVLKIKRAADGSILSISKRPGFLATEDGLTQIFPEEVKFSKNSQGKCYPQNYNNLANPMNRFNTDLCKDLQAFYDQNPAAQHCIKEGYGNKLARILLSYKVPGFKEEWGKLTSFRESPDVKAMNEIAKCDEYKLTALVTDKEFWGHNENAAPVTLESNTIRQ